MLLFFNTYSQFIWSKASWPFQFYAVNHNISFRAKIAEIKGIFKAGNVSDGALFIVLYVAAKAPHVTELTEIS